MTPLSASPLELFPNLIARVRILRYFTSLLAEYIGKTVCKNKKTFHVWNVSKEILFFVKYS